MNTETTLLVELQVINLGTYYEALHNHGFNTHFDFRGMSKSDVDDVATQEKNNH